MRGPELDLLEGGGGKRAAFDPGARIEHAMSCENARLANGGSLRPWASFIITGNADYVSSLAVRAQFLARGVTRGELRYQRYYRLAITR